MRSTRLRHALPATAITLVTLLLGAAGGQAIGAATAATTTAATTVTSDGDRATFEAISPARLLDTRLTGQGPALGVRAERAVQVTGVAGVPADATAVVLNLTVVKPTQPGVLTAYPTGGTRPVASNVNFVAGQIVPNLATVKVGADGKVTMFNNSSGVTHLVVDIAGYYRGHAHDDQYLTKAEAQARTAANAFTCGAGQLLQAVAADGAPTCATDQAGPAYAAGFGLTLDGTTFSAEQGRNAANAFQCNVGSFLRAVAADGAPTCAIDQAGPTYTAGAGITISGTTINAAQRREGLSPMSCPPGQSMQSVAASGAATCITATYTAGPGLTLNGSQFSAAHGPTVVHVRGDQEPAANGTLLRNTLAALPGPSATTPYVLSLAPGTYDVGATSLTMRPGVSIIGAGRGITTITGRVVSQSGGLVNLANGATLARLSVLNQGTGASWATAVMANGSMQARIAEVEARAEQPGGGSAYGLIAFYYSNVHAENSTFIGTNSSGSGTGIYAVTSAAVLARGVEAYSAAGSGYSLQAYNASRIMFTGGVASGAILRETTNSLLQVSFSRIEGQATGGVQCFSVHDAAWAPVTCS